MRRLAARQWRHLLEPQAGVRNRHIRLRFRCISLARGSAERSCNFSHNVAWLYERLHVAGQVAALGSTNMAP